MTIVEGIFLGVLQGIAEFLPISSSGHLQVAQNILGLGEVPLLFDVFLHLATLLSVVLFFRKKIWTLLCAFGRLIARRPPKENTEFAVAMEKNWRAYILAVILATVVTGTIGVVTSKLIKNISVKLVCAGFVCTALLLILSALIEKSRARKATCTENISGTEKAVVPAELKAPSWWQSLLIGLAQGIGTLPGISRSGSTIAGSLFCGMNREAAGEFSFIVSIPAILGAFILELKDIGELSGTVGWEPVLAGCAAAFASGYIALTLLMKIIRRGKLEWFACYLIPAGILGMIFLH